MQGATEEDDVTATSTWHRVSPGRALLRDALALVAAHPAMKKAFASPAIEY